MTSKHPHVKTYTASIDHFVEDAFIHAFIHTHTRAFRPARVRTPPPRLSLAVANASSSSADARARALASIAADVDAMHEYPVNVTDERGNARRFVVRFPYVAYENQMDFIERALTAMVRGESALLESPTGTGKTLCLLAASLAYARAAGNRKKRKFREDVRAMKEMLRSGDETPRGDENAPPRGGDASTSEGTVERIDYLDEEVKRERTKAPVVVYATRTHSQVSQVVRELKLLDPTTRAATLASRKHACVRKDVREMTGKRQNDACSKLLTEHRCSAKITLDRGLEKRLMDFKLFGDGVDDIEDLVKKGQKNGPCPFYLSRTRCANAEIIFMPYNYLLDADVRRGLDIVWSEAVVVVDEAHNLESAAADSMSFSLTAGKLAKAIKEAERAYETKLTYDDDSGEGIVLEGQRDVFERGMGKEAAAFKAEDFEQMAKVLVRLEQNIDSMCRQSKEGQKNGIGERVGDGNLIYEILEALNITDETYKHFTELMRAAAKTVLLGGDVLSHASESDTPLTSFANFIDRIFKDRFPEYFCTRLGPDLDNKLNTSNREREGATLSYWCFFPGLCLKELIEKQVGSFLLASGTLSPMESFASELAMEFPVRLENPHVIKQNQVWGGVVTRGPNGNVLNSSFRFRDTIEYKNEIGQVILSAMKMIPDGLLVFFPSYGVMHSCIKHWRFTGVWRVMESSKICEVEPSNAEEFKLAYARYNEVIDSGTGPGATFFAVCRGKVSEGIDFADKACRGVILTGIPYAGAKDPLVMNKRKYLDRRKLDHGGSYSGNVWYSQTAMRAVNQALGRVIRHKDDFGAVILADERFADEHARNQLSLWLRPSIHVHPVFSSAVNGLKDFFRGWEASGSKSKPIAQPAKFADISAPRVSALANTRKKARTEDAPRKSSIASLVRQFTKDQDEADAPARQQFVVSTAKVPLQSTAAETARGALSKKTNEAMKKSSLLTQLSNFRGGEQGIEANVKDENEAPTNSERTKFFMRRAQMELSRESYEELLTELDKVNLPDFNIGNLLRVANRVLKAPENPKGLYALFGEFVPAAHKPTYEKHRQALIERHKKLKSEKLANATPGLAVATSPRECVACAEPCRQPFEASSCKHVACYACWRRLLKPNGPGKCPSCNKDVLRRHLVKKFF